MITNLYYDGDSYSCSYGPGVSTNSGIILAKRLGLELKHYGMPGKSHYSSIRNAMRYCFNGWHRESFMCIGIGVNSRFETIGSKKVDSTNLILDEELYTSTVSIKESARIHEILGHDYLLHEFFLDLILLHDFLSKNNANFIIHNLFIDYNVDKDLPFAKKIHEQIKLRPRIINFFENSLHGLMLRHEIAGVDEHEYGRESSHPNEEGHKMYSDFLYSCIIKYLD